MLRLHELQRMFAANLSDKDLAVAAHIVEDDFSPPERLGIYRNSCRSVLIEVLRMPYPAVDRLVGRDFFEMAAEQFCAVSPPQAADI